MSGINFFATRSRFSPISRADGFVWEDTVGSRVKKEVRRAVSDFNRALESENAAIERIAAQIDSLFSAVNG